MERDDLRNQKIQEFVSRVRTTPYGAMLESTEATKIAKLFLRARKFDVTRALELYKSYKHMRYSNQLEVIDPLEDGVRRELLSEKFTVLPHTSAVDPTVLVFTVRRHWPPNCTDRDVLKGIIYQLDAALLDEQTQEQGITVIYDMTDAKYSNFGADLSMKLLNLLTGSYPARVRNILIIAAPFWFRPPYHLSRLFVKDKIRERIFAIERRQLVNFLPIASIPKCLGGTLPHKHIDWLRTCFDRLGSKALANDKEDDYFNPMKAVSPSLVLGRRMSFTQSQQLFSQQQLERNPIHHFPHQRMLVNGSNGTRTISTIPTRRDPTAWTYNRLLRPGAPKNNFSSTYHSDDEATNFSMAKSTNSSTILVNNNNNSNSNNGNAKKDNSSASVSTATSLTSPTRISVTQFLAEFPRKFPTAFEREFETSIKPTGGGSPTNGASRFSDPANWPKNRYVDVPCLDHSAVTLPDDAYIHANYVDGYKRKRAYILTQGPLDSTSADFWQMVWTTGASIIIMLTKTVENGKVKCGQYWPSPDINHGQSTLRFPPFTITNTKQTLEANGLYTLSQLQLARTNFGELRQVEHYLFLGWPDFDVPREPKGFLTFLDVIDERLRQLVTNAPLIIHCSAGVGRTGTFTAIDICLAQAKSEGFVDVPGVVSRIRQQRACSVQLAKQYAFVYQALYTRLKSTL
ncbi:hypothetical protein Aperf_G00000108800 [Anoplocephala perfoliata]